jgi:hypothetical protein
MIEFEGKERTISVMPIESRKWKTLIILIPVNDVIELNQTIAKIDFH